MKCNLRGSGAEDEYPPDVLWLRDGQILRFTDTNQFQIYTGNNSWAIISTLRYAVLCVALIFFSPPLQSDKDLDEQVSLQAATPAPKMSVIQLLPLPFRSRSSTFTSHLAQPVARLRQPFSFE